MSSHPQFAGHERWMRIEAIALEALELPPDERSAFLARACDGDDAMRLEVESLLPHAEADSAFLAAPLLRLEAIAPGEPMPPDHVADSIGAYRIVRRLGRGGMGEVFLATRAAEDIEQQVALKVIRRGMDTDEVLQRFRLERRILASLDHPNIARFLDAAATDDGRPYVVMEYVEGVPIDEYCDRKGLGLRERLECFLVICGAVQHAHQNLVVHRDIKPRNILVTADGTPKLLDFGIGKVLAPTDSLSPGHETATQARLLTPEYAAPEQVTGAPVTTATDVHGLGILLYELLTGRHPFIEGEQGLREVEHAVLEVEPRRPSEVVPVGDTRALRRALAGDLDTIVLKALRKDPLRRYASAAELADDLRRHLDGLPVRARPDTLGYRARKFVRRNAAWLAAAGVAFVALTTTAVVTLVQSRRVARESARVAEERDKALEVRSFLMEMFGASGAGRAVGDTITARQLLDVQAAGLERAYADRPDLMAEMLEVVADGYDRLGLYQTAEPLAREALALRRRLLPPDDPGIATALNLHGWILHELGRSTEAEEIIREAVTIRRAAGARFRADLARSLNDLGVVLQALGRYADAHGLLAEALEIRRAELGDRHRAVGVTASNLAAGQYLQGKVAEAIATQQLALDALRQSVGPDHQRSIIALGNLATFRVAAGEWDDAVRDYRDLIERQTRLQGPQHPVTARVMLSLAATLSDVGAFRGDEALLREAEQWYARSLASFESALGATHPQVGTALYQLAATQAALDRPREARANAERGLEIVQRALGERHQSTAAGLQHVARIRRQAGDVSGALALQRRAVAAFEAALGADNGQTARARVGLCSMLLDRGADGDIELGAQACAAGDSVLRRDPDRYRHASPIARILLARARRLQGQGAVADSLLEAARRDVAAGWGGVEAKRLLETVMAAAK